MSRRTIVDPRFPELLRRLRTERGLSLRELARRAYLGKSTVSDLERGVGSPGVATVVRLDRLLDGGGELAALVTETCEEPRAGRDGGLALVDVAGEPGRPLDADDVVQLCEAVPQLVRLDNTYGADDIHSLAVRMFRTAGGKLAAGAYRPEVESDLQAAVGEIGEVAAWLLYDADRQEDSRRINSEAMMISRLAGDRAMELLELANMAMQSVHLRRGREALRIAESVLAVDRLTPQVAGLFHLRRARALAELGERGRALDALAQARALLADGAGQRDPAWAWWIDDKELTWHTAMLYADLGEQHRAVDLFHAATRDYPAVGRRQYSHLAHLLDALTLVSTWADAEQILVEVLSYVDQVGSTRTERLLARSLLRIERADVPDSLGDLARVLDGRLSGVR